MRRKVLSLAIVLALLIFSVMAQENLAPDEITGEAIYVAFPVSISLDGNLDDWANIPSAMVSRGVSPSNNPAENGSFTVSLAADMDNIYITMAMPDQNIITGQHGQDYWNEDSLEFYFNFSDRLGTTSYNDAIFQININPSNIGTTDPAALVYTGVNATLAGVEAIVFATEDGWAFEAVVPLAIEPEHGLVVGFNAHANGASELDRNVKLIWSLADTADSSYFNPSVFGQAIFFEVGREDIPEMAEISIEAPMPDTNASLERERSITAVNQVGYFVNAVKRAVYGTTSPLESAPTWELKNADSGAVVLSGITDDGFLDAASGDTIYLADFSGFNETGRYLITINGLDSVPFEIGNSIYGDLSRDALHYFYQNRSGIALTADYAGEAWVHDAGHPTDNDVTCWSGTDGDGKPWNACDYRLDASGGWYDAGDYGKYVVNGGITVWTLLNWYEYSPESFPDGSLAIPENGNAIPDILDEVRWEMDFLLRMQVPAGQPQAGMVHHKLHDSQWSGVPVMPVQTAPNDDPENGRYLMPPSTAATLNLAATGAQCARVYAPFDAEFAAKCLEAAEIAWQAALDNPNVFYGNIPGAGGGNYDDSSVEDEFFWAAAELYITTGEDAYLDYLMNSVYFENSPSLQAGQASPMYWGDTASLGIISLATVPNNLPETEVNRLRDELIAAADYYFDVSWQDGYAVPFQASQYVWGSNSLVLNNALVMALAYDFTGDARYLDGVIEATNYILGRNPINQSYVSGYGTFTMQHPHHRFWGNTGNFPPPPNGALAGGANGAPSDPTAIEQVNEMPASRRYIDDIGSYSTNEVAINWNAPLVWVVSYLDEQYNK